MIEKWVVYNKSADFYGIGEKYNIDPVIARVIRNRDISEDKISSYLQPDIEQLYSPWLLKDMDKAVTLIMEDINNHKKIRIVSDYDVDGVMSNYILLKALEYLGAQVDYEIPDRIQDGYGINEDIIKRAYEDGVDTILTCDNGISAIPQIKYAKGLGIKVIITDHHDIPYEIDEEGKKEYSIVDADAVINPKQIDCSYPFKSLCGAGVAYKLIDALFEKNNVDKAYLSEFIQFVAIATVCDVMDLIDENRIFVKYGLESINQTRNIGLKALIDINQLDKKIRTYHLGFVIGPCINATGRLDSAKLSLKLFLEEDSNKATKKAEELKKLNDSRKEMTIEGTQAGILQIEEQNMIEDKILVIYLPDVHESLAGIIAGRIKEIYYKPTIVITKTEENRVKGSGRSIEAYNMYDGISECKKLLIKFGGHPMAAGFTLFESNVNSFREKLNFNCQLSEEDFQPKLKIDVAMPIDYLTMDLTNQLDVLEPFGKGNEKPVFAHKNLKVNSAKILGVKRNVIKLMLESDVGTVIEGVYFQPEEFTNTITDWFGYEECDKMLHGWLNDVRINLAYYPSINDYRDVKNLQLVVISYSKYEDSHV